MRGGAGVLLEHHAADALAVEALKIFNEYKTGHPFDAPNTRGTIVYPGVDGGGEWGGPAFDPTTGLLADSSCAAQVSVPFLSGAVPTGYAPCANAGQSSPLDWIKDIFR